MKEKIISIIENFVIKNSSTDDIHGFQHVKRVYRLCVKIGKILKAKLLILKIASLLHDIGRQTENQISYEKNHVEISTKLTLQFLKKNNFNLTEKEIKTSALENRKIFSRM